MIAVIFTAFVFGVYFFVYIRQSKDTWPPPHAVKLPGSETWVLDNELTILASGQNIESLVKKFSGKIMRAVPETETYQVRFPVSGLEELDVIANKLREKENGIEVVYSILMPPPELGGEFQ